MQGTPASESPHPVRSLREHLIPPKQTVATWVKYHVPEELKSSLMKVKEESEKVGLKFNIQKTNVMASGSITSWQIDGETVADFIFLGSKINADVVTTAMKLKDAFSLEEISNLESILKSRDITLPTKFRLVKAMVFPVVMYGCESWIIKKKS